MKKGILFLLGFSLTVGGIALSITHWQSLVEITLSVLGPLLAVAGLVMMFAVSIKK